MASKADRDGAVESSNDEVGRKRRIGQLFRIGLKLLIIAAAVFALSNVFLWSALGTGLAEAELKKRTALDWEIDSLSWSPWNGVTVYGAEILQPAELRDQVSESVLQLEELRVEPYWKQLLRGRMQAKVVEINQPRGVLCVEMLASIASNMSGSEPVTQQGVRPEATAKNSPEVSRQKPPRQVTKNQPKKKGSPAEKSPPPAPKNDTAKRRVSEFPVRVIVKGAGLKLRSLHLDRALVDIEGCDFDMQLLGDESVGTLGIASFSLLDMEPLTDLKQQIVWRAPYLQLPEQTFNLGGVSIRTIAQVGVGRSPVGQCPFQILLAVDEQKLEGVPLTEHIAMKVSAEKMESILRINGYLSRPVSWQADGLMLAKHLALTEQHGRHRVDFESVQLPFVYRGGVLLWDRMYLMSEDLAVLGNGRVSLRDGHLSVTRLVTSPHGAAIMHRGLVGAGITSSGVPWWETLDTPDRMMRDFLVSGPLLDPYVDAGTSHQNIQLRKMLDILLKFVRQEMREEGKTLRALPRKKAKNS